MAYQTTRDETGKGELDLEQIHVPSYDVVDNYRSLLEDKEHSDVTISVNGKEYQTHRAILAAQCPKFKAMFRNNWKESQEGKVELSDIEEDVFKELLDYIYTGKSILQEKSDYLLAVKLIRAADEYQLDHLKSICEKALDDTKSIENAIEVLSTASLFSLTQLEKRTIVFISKHADEIFQRDEWKRLAESNLSLTNKVLTDLVTYLLRTDICRLKTDTKQTSVMFIPDW